MIQPLSTASFYRTAAQFGAAAVVGITAGSIVTLFPLGALALVALPPIAFVLRRPERIFAVVLLGAMVLTYGFANVGFRIGPLPVPLADVALLGLALYALRKWDVLKAIGVPGMLLAGYFAFALVRLAWDYPVWGIDAVRDFTTPFESLATLMIAFVLTRRCGSRWTVRLWTLVLATVTLYGLLYPARDVLGSAGPVVGLQQPVALVSFTGIGMGLGGAFLFFLLVAKRSAASFPFTVAATVIIGLAQARGLYLFVPLALLVAFVAAYQTGRLRRALARAIATSAVVMVLLLGTAVFDVRLEGRLGTVDAGFAASQLLTLLGEEGPGTGTFEHRLLWLEDSWGRVTEDPVTFAFGVGLGPDLAGGFASSAVLVRKPHNDYLELLVRLGILGAGLWLAFLGTAVAGVWRGLVRRRAPSESAAFLAWVLSASVLYLGIAATQPVLAFVYGTVPLFAMLGSGLAVVSQGTSQATNTGYEHRRKSLPGGRPESVD